MSQQNKLQHGQKPQQKTYQLQYEDNYTDQDTLLTIQHEAEGEIFNVWNLSEPCPQRIIFVTAWIEATDDASGKHRDIRLKFQIDTGIICQKDLPPGANVYTSAITSLCFYYRTSSESPGACSFNLKIRLDRISQLTSHKRSFLRRFARTVSGFFKSE